MLMFIILYLSICEDVCLPPMLLLVQFTIVNQVVYRNRITILYSFIIYLSNTILVSYFHSFRLFLQHLFKSTNTQGRSRHSTDTVPEFHAEAPQAIASERLAQCPYMAARAGVEPTTLRLRVIAPNWDCQMGPTHCPKTHDILRLC